MFDYSAWRHGGWYVHNVRYPSGAIGCVSRNYSDGKWRIVCENTGPGEPGDRTFPNRDAAAQAEMERAARMHRGPLRLDVVYAANLKPGDALAGYLVIDAPTTPVQPMAAALTLTEVTRYDDGGTAMVRLRAGDLELFSARTTAQALVIRGART
jgi:hypothetical protein